MVGSHQVATIADQMATDPPRSPSLEEIGALVRHLAASVAVIHERLDRLEQLERPPAPPAAGWAQPAGSASSGPTQPAAATPGVTAATPMSPPVAASPGGARPSPGPAALGQAWMHAAVAPPPRAPWWQVGPLQSVTPDKAPIVALAAAGGLAVLAGMLFFVWYAVERGWLSPTARLVIGGAAGLGMLLAAWPLADRNRSVAGGLGGAGLGTWFGVWIVARHVHDLVGPTETFIGLAAVSAACLVVSGLRELRLMALLGALGAFVTPIATATGADRLTELMLYQLLVMTALVALEQLRRWPELGHIAIAGTWLLLAGWAEQHLAPASADKLLAWTVVLLVVGSAQTVLLRLRGLPGHAAGRQLMGGTFAWAAAAAATLDRPDPLAWATLGMAVWHLGLFGWSRARGPSQGLHAVLLGLGWVQLCVFGPLSFEDTGLAGYWLGQGLVGALAVVVVRGWLPVTLAVPPLLGVLAFVGDAGPEDPGLFFGLAVAAVIVVIAVWPTGGDPHVEPAANEPDGPMAVFLFVIAGLVAGWSGEEHLQRTALAPLAVLGVGLVGTLRAFVRLDPQRVRGSLFVLALGLVWAVGHVVVDELLERADAGSARAAVAVAAVLVGALALALLVLLRRGPRAFATVAELHDLAGILVVLGPALALQMVIGSWLYAQGPRDPHVWSLVLASMSVIGAVASLAGLVAGLRFQREPWRKLALGGLAAVAVKVVLVDLSEVDIAYRVLSFVGLGACMLLGAIAYGRALRRYGVAGDPSAGGGQASRAPADEEGT